jgi:transketolase
MPDLWRKYVGLDGDVMGIPTFGESGPAGEVYKHFGLTTEALVERVSVLAKANA